MCVVVFVDDEANGGCFFCSIGGLCYGLFMIVGFENSLPQFQGSEMSPGLFQDFMDGYIKPCDSPH